MNLDCSIHRIRVNLTGFLLRVGLVETYSFDWILEFILIVDVLEDIHILNMVSASIDDL